MQKKKTINEQFNNNKVSKRRSKRVWMCLIQGQRIAQEIKVPSAPQERVHTNESLALEK